MKKALLFFFGLALGLASCSNNGSNITYDVYTNPRFGFSIMYPTFLTPQPEPQNGDGRLFSNGKDEEMSVYASFNVLDQSIEDLFLECQNYYDGTMTYVTKEDNWFVVSGTNSEGIILYRKTILKDNVEYTVSITYPKEKKQQYEKIVKKVAESFKVGLEVTTQEN